MFYDARASGTLESSKIQCFMTPGRLSHKKTQKFNVLWRPGVWHMRKLKNLMFFDAQASGT